MKASLNLVVIRGADMDGLAKFYSLLGLEFTKHAHGKGPEHYSSESDGIVFEIYSLTDPAQSTAATRLGFKVESIDTLVLQLGAQGGTIVSPPKQSEWGKRAVISDPAGHKVELLEN